jgi:hypothetical protein
MISDSDWIKANPNRWFRLRPSELRERTGYAPREMGNLNYATVVSVSEGRRIWGCQDILVVGEILDSDAAAKFALKFWETELLDRILGRGGAR